MFNTLEIGPRINEPAPRFLIQNHEQREVMLEELVGRRGLVIGFTGGIWQPASVRRILWLQRHAGKFMRHGIYIALALIDEPHMLYGFYMSTARPLGFPLLADVDYGVHDMYNMTHAGLVLLDSDLVVRDKWLVPDERIWPKATELTDAFEKL